MEPSDDKKFDWVKVIALVTAVVSLIAAGISCREASLELAAKQVAEQDAQRARTRAETAETNSKQLQQQIDAQLDTIRRFMEFYANYLREIRNAQSRLAEFRSSPGQSERVAGAERDLRASIEAFVKFIQNWRSIQEQLATLLDGDVTRLQLAAARG